MNIGRLHIGCASRPADGFAAGGDAFVTQACGDVAILVIIDVLGHGPLAHEVAQVAENMFERSSVCDAPSALTALDVQMGGTIGAAAGAASVDTSTGQACFVGVGNTVARVFGDRERRLSSVDGIVGQRHASFRPVDFILRPGETLVLHTDGITSRFESTQYPRLLSDEVATVARELIRRFGKNHDDTACIAARLIP